MHAASVHPEPGSNSRMFCIYSSLKTCLNLFIRAIYSSFFYFLFEFLSGISSSFCFALRFALYSIPFVVQFSMTDFATALAATALLLYHTQTPLSTPFFTFFKVFLSFDKMTITCPFRETVLSILTKRREDAPPKRGVLFPFYMAYPPSTPRI